MMLVSGGSKRLRLFMSKIIEGGLSTLHALWRKISKKNEKFCTALFIGVFITFLMNPINDFHTHLRFILK